MAKKIPPISFGFVFVGDPMKYQGADIEAHISADGIITLRDPHTFDTLVQLPVAEWGYFEEFMDFVNSVVRNTVHAMEQEDEPQ